MAPSPPQSPALISDDDCNGAGEGDIDSDDAAAAGAANNGDDDAATAAAVADVEAQLRQQGGRGKVWVQGWDSRQLRSFLESHPDRFRLLLLSGKRYTVEAVGDLRSEDISSAPSGGGSGGADDTSFVELCAVEEIAGQLRGQGGHGKVYIDDWSRRFGALGASLRIFLERRSDRFSVVPAQQGRGYTVLLLADEESAEGEEREGAGETIVIDDPPDGAANGAGGGCAEDAAAATELRRQLVVQGGSGKVWIHGWSAQRLRAFLQGHPELFCVVPGQGNGYSVALVGQVPRQPPSRPPPAALPALPARPSLAAVRPPPAVAAMRAATAGGSGDGGGAAEGGLAEEAMWEMEAQLREQGGYGKVYINDWRQRFGALGSMRAFLESRPDRFSVIAGQGSAYSVSILATRRQSTPAPHRPAPPATPPPPQALQRAVAAASAAHGPQAPARVPPSQLVPPRRLLQGLAKQAAAAGAPPGQGRGVKRPRAGGAGGAVVGGGGRRAASSEAIGEIEEQLYNQGGVGKVWIDDWKGRFSQLGTCRTFMESFPDRFCIIPGAGTAYTVALVSR